MIDYVPDPSDRVETWESFRQCPTRDDEPTRQEMADAAGLSPQAIDDALAVDPGARRRLAGLVKKQRAAKALGQWKEGCE